MPDFLRGRLEISPRPPHGHAHIAHIPGLREQLSHLLEHMFQPAKTHGVCAPSRRLSLRVAPVNRMTRHPVRSAAFACRNFANALNIERD